MRIPLVVRKGVRSAATTRLPRRASSSASHWRRGCSRASRRSAGRLWLSSTSQTAQIVGVVGDVKHRALDDDFLPTVYLSALQAPSHSSIVVVRSARPDADAIATVREEVARLDPNLPVYTVQSMERIVAASPGVPARRVLTAAFTGFAALAVVLGALGLFGVAAHDVASRRAELALRIALGADPTRILARHARSGRGDGWRGPARRRRAVDLDVACARQRRPRDVATRSRERRGAGRDSRSPPARARSCRSRAARRGPIR